MENLSVDRSYTGVILWIDWCRLEIITCHKQQIKNRYMILVSQNTLVTHTINTAAHYTLHSAEMVELDGEYYTSFLSNNVNLDPNIAMLLDQCNISADVTTHE